MRKETKQKITLGILTATILGGYIASTKYCGDRILEEIRNPNYNSSVGRIEKFQEIKEGFNR